MKKLDVQQLLGKLSSNTKSFLGKADTKAVSGWIPISHLLDRLISMRPKVGGIPMGRLTEISGKPMAEKTSMLHLLQAAVQNSGGIAVHFAYEVTYDETRFKLAGGSPKDLVLFVTTQNEAAKKKKIERLTIERFFEFSEELLANISGQGIPAIIGVDSLNAACIRSELEQEELTTKGQSWGEKAILLEKGFKRLMPLIENEPIAIVWINHLKEKKDKFITRLDTAGGAALKFYASLRLQNTNVETIKRGDKSDPVGNIVRIKTVKNKVGPPLKSIELPFLFHTGRFDEEWSIARYAIDAKLGDPPSKKKADSESEDKPAKGKRGNIWVKDKALSEAQFRYILHQDDVLLEEYKERCWQHMYKKEQEDQLWASGNLEQEDILEEDVKNEAQEEE